MNMKRYSSYFIVCLVLMCGTAWSQQVLVDLGQNATTGVDGSGRYWNNITNYTNGSVANAVDIGNVSTGISFTVTNAFWYHAESGKTTGTTGYPATATGDTFYASPSRTPGSVTIANLDASKTYAVKLFGSASVVPPWGKTQYTVVGATTQSVVLECSDNFNNTVTVSGMAPDANNRIRIDVTYDPNTSGAAQGHLGVIDITGTVVGPPASFFEWNAASSPHAKHIVSMVTDWMYNQTPAELDWVAGHYDWVLGGAYPDTTYKSRNASIKYGKYVIHLTVKAPGQENPSLGVSYYPDMQTWYAAHPQYNIENAFLHVSGERMTSNIWASLRWAINPGDPGLIAYNQDRFGRVCGTSDDFVFIDEHSSDEINRFAGSDEYPVLADLQNAVVALLTAERASLGRPIQINTAEYITTLDKRCVIAAGADHMELANNPFNQFNPDRWTFQDQCLDGGAFVETVSARDFAEAAALTGYPAGNDLSVAGRFKMCELASYYMVVRAPGGQMSIFMSNNGWGNHPWSAQWIAASEVNVGAPLAARYVYQSGTDGRGKAYVIYARNFDKCLVLYRPAKAWDDQVWGDDTIVNVNLPGGETWKQVRSDGTLAGSFVTSFNLRQAEAMIMMKGSRLGLPTTPAQLKATAAGTTQINLAWLDYSNDESTFRIERKTGSGGTYAEIGTTSANVTAYSDTTCSGSTTYFYRVRSRTSAGVNSAYSNEDNATTPAGISRILVDLGQNATTGVDGSGRYWNNITNGTNGSVANAVDISNVSTGISFAVTNAFYYHDETGKTTGTTGYPATATGDTFYTYLNGGDTLGSVTISNLSASKTYDVKLFGSASVVPPWGTTQYTVVGATTQSVVLATSDNFNNTVTVSGMAPDANNQIRIDVTHDPNTTGAQEGHLGVIDLTIH